MRPRSKWALRRLKRQIDALWILNDDHLLTPGLIADGWLPGLEERPFCPTIVGAASLLSPSSSFGAFAMLPDHTALGVQAANILFDLAEHDWILPPNARVESPQSTTTNVDLTQVRERFSLRAKALSQVDKIVE
jgi:putative ABC transport system substrate-binding protein